MASIRKRGNSYLLVVSMGYAPGGRRRNPQQKTVRPPTGLTPKQTEKWLQEQAMIFEMSCKKLNPDIDRSITLEKYTEIWLQTIAPDKASTSVATQSKQPVTRLPSKRRRRKPETGMCTFPLRWKARSASTKPSAPPKPSATTGASRPRMTMYSAEKAWSCR